MDLLYTIITNPFFWALISIFGLLGSINRGHQFASRWITVAGSAFGAVFHHRPADVGDAGVYRSRASLQMDGTGLLAA